MSKHQDKELEAAWKEIVDGKNEIYNLRENLDMCRNSLNVMRRNPLNMPEGYTAYPVAEIEKLLSICPPTGLTMPLDEFKKSLIPEGWQLVPIEPTEYMLEQSGCRANWCGDTHGADQNHIDWWKAMLDSAPKPEESQ